MGRQPKHREAILSASLGLFRNQGYASTGIAEILKASGAPKGSLYHYYPGGKEAVAAEAVSLAGTVVLGTLEELANLHSTSAGFLSAYIQLLGDWLERSDFRQGCPIATTLLETTPHSEAITAAGDAALASWQTALEAVFLRDAHAPQQARDRAILSICAIEGALILARVQCSRDPLERVEKQLLAML